MKTSRYFRVCLLAVGIFWSSLAFATPALGQNSVSAGDRIRITLEALDRDRIKGEVLEVGGGALAFRSDDGDLYLLGLNEIRELEVSTGKNRLAGTLAGALTGALFLGFIGSGIERATADSCFDYCGLGGFLLGFGVGAIAGSAAGYALLGSDQWQEVSKPYSTSSRSPEVRFQISL
jgi:hypothetical protein